MAMISRGNGISGCRRGGRFFPLLSLAAMLLFSAPVSAQMFSDRGFRESLQTSDDAVATQHLFADWEPNAPADRRSAL
jgi:hypothetical protein